MAQTKNEKTRLSQSQLWNHQKSFYAEMGPDAWMEKIPFFSTSNSFIAHAYVNIIASFMDAWDKANPGNDAPFYILELGTGTGMFGFHVVSQLQERQKNNDSRTSPFVYVMSDFVERNITFWRSHPALQPHISNGVLGFAKYEIGSSESIDITLPGIGETRTISPSHPTQKPIIVIANYIFDSLPVDVFRIAEGKLKEALTRPHIRTAPNADMNMLGIMDDAGFDFTYNDVQSPYYSDENYNAVLTGYGSSGTGMDFLFPVGALNCIRNLSEMSAQKVFLLSTDKGYGANHPMAMLQKPDIALHNNAFSVTVNFHAIGEYALRTGGNFHHQRFQGQVNTSVFSFGFDFKRSGTLSETIKHFIDHCGASNLFDIYNVFHRIRETCSPEEIIAYLSVLNWDPYVVNESLQLLQAYAPQLSSLTIANILEGLEESAAKFYPIPGSPLFYNNIGVFYQNLQHYQQALNYYKLSVLYQGNQGVSSYNAALCYYFLGEFESAISSLEQALDLGYPEQVLIKGWILQCQEELGVKRSA